jgi:hypothetical protein
LGPLNYLRIWHDNTGREGSASWFLKYIIVRDLQTMIKTHFICQRWFAVEKDDSAVSLSLLLIVDQRVYYLRLNVFYQLLVNTRNKNWLMFYQNMPIIVCPKVIYGFRYFLDHYQVNLLVFNDVHAVSYYYSLQCFSIFFIMNN